MTSLLALALWAALPAAAQSTAPVTAPSTAPATAPDVSASTESDEVPFDPANYPKSGIEAMRRSDPCRPGRPFEIKDEMFSAEVRWNGAVRRASPADYDLLRHWTKHIGDPDAVVRYKEETTVSEGRHLEWVSVPEGLLAYLQMDLQAGDRVLLYMVLTGCARGHHVFAVDDYDVPDQTDQESRDQLIMLPGPRPGGPQG